MIRIVLCDDHEIVRKGLRQLLQEQSGFSVLDDVASGEELLKVLRKKKPDVIILDVALPGRSGLESLKQIRELYPDIHVLVLSMYPEDQFAVRMIRAGASGYLHKDSPPQVLNEAIQTIAQGGKYVSHRIMSLLFNEVISGRKDNEPLYKNLSDREFDVLLQLAKGRKVGEIAENMLLSIKTVSTYKRRIFEKLNVRTLVDLINYVEKHRLLQMPANS